VQCAHSMLRGLLASVQRSRARADISPMALVCACALHA